MRQERSDGGGVVTKGKLDAKSLMTTDIDQVTLIDVMPDKTCLGKGAAHH